MTKNLQDIVNELSEKSPINLYDITGFYTEDSKIKARNSKIQNSGKPSWNSGTELSSEHKQSISKAKAGKPNVKKRKPIQTPKGVFIGLAEAALAYGKTTVTIWNWTKTKPREFYYITESEI